jgi:hypothetical protein
VSRQPQDRQGIAVVLVEQQVMLRRNGSTAMEGTKVSTKVSV